MRCKCSQALPWALIAALSSVFITVLLINSTAQQTWVNIPAHSFIETAGVLAALSLAALLAFLHAHTPYPYRITTAMGLSAMALLDLFHASIPPGDTIIWLHGFASLSGGIYFLGVYFDKLRFGHRSQIALPLLAGAIAASSGLLIIRYTSFLPPAFQGQQFATGILLINVLAGCMFLAAAFRFYALYQASQSSETLLFTMMSLMFGIAGLAFPFSSIWNATWWIWHLLRFAAYALSLGYMAFLFLETYKHLQQNEAMLKTVLGSLDSGIITVDSQGRILACNPAVERLFGYTEQSLNGSSIMILIGQRPDYSLGQHADGSSFPVHINLSAVSQDNQPLFILQISDITEHREIEQQLSHQAHHDALTQLPNRLLLLDRLSQSIAQAHRHQQMFAVMFIDLDNFKQINDQHGHHVGDYMLRHVASQLKRCIREGDTAARLSGDEFVLIILDVDNAKDCATVAEKVLHDVAGHIELDGKSHQISCSIGICLYPYHGEDATTLLIHADKAMYQAKMNGRNNFCLYNRAPVRTALATRKISKLPR